MFCERDCLKFRPFTSAGGVSVRKVSLYYYGLVSPTHMSKISRDSSIWPYLLRERRWKLCSSFIVHVSFIQALKIHSKNSIDSLQLIVSETIIVIYEARLSLCGCTPGRSRTRKTWVSSAWHSFIDKLVTSTEISRTEMQARQGNIIVWGRLGYSPKVKNCV